MHSFHIITDTMLLHLAQKPLIVLTVLCALMIAAAVLLVRRELRRSKSDANHAQPPEDSTCC